MSTDVVATGLGLMTGLGLDLDSSWDGLVAGRCPARRFTLFDPDGLPGPFGVELPDGAEERFTAGIKRRRRSQMARGTMIAVLTAREAIVHSALDWAEVDRSRVGVVLGTTGTGYVPPESGVDEHRILRNMSNAPAAWISLEHKLTGPSFVVGTACSSGAYAIGLAHGLITSGSCDVVIAGAADSSINYLDVQGFGSLMALADGQEDFSSASRPFDKHRRGFVMGEGGGMVVLEAAEHARRRSATLFAQVWPPGICSEAYNIVSPQRGGAGMAAAMRRSLEQAGLASTDVDYVNAHGTSTDLNDLYETMAIKEVFGTRAKELPVSATKSMTGHCLAAAAGIEAVIAIKALYEGVIPPTANLTEPDPELDLDFVPQTARRRALRHVMSNSFAFGGHNGVNVFSKAQ